MDFWYPEIKQLSCCGLPKHAKTTVSPYFKSISFFYSDESSRSLSRVENGEDATGKSVETMIDRWQPRSPPIRAESSEGLFSMGKKSSCTAEFVSGIVSRYKLLHKCRWQVKLCPICICWFSFCFFKLKLVWELEVDNQGDRRTLAPQLVSKFH